MEQGFMLDVTFGGYGSAQWAAGPPPESARAARNLWHERLPIGTFRCSSCGYLESYARPEFATKLGRVKKLLVMPISSIFRRNS